MWPSEVPSDIGLQEESREHLSGRWSLLVDLCSEFQGASGAYMFLAFLVPIVASVLIYFCWTDRPLLWLSVATLSFVAFASISAFSFIFYRWAKSRERLAWELMNSRSDDE